MPQVLYVKNMVCGRCIAAVERNLKKLSIPYSKVELGEVVLEQPLEEAQREALSRALEENGFELLKGKNALLIEKIKTVIIDLVHYLQEHPRVNYSEYIAEKLHHDYNYLSTLFSSVEGITIEKFIILQKTEKVKELLFYNEMNLSEIARFLGYSSVQHLSNQFKKVTGMSPSRFKAVKTNQRKPLDKLT